MIINRLTSGCLVAACSFAFAAHADVKLPHILSDGAVLQQKTNASLFGWASPGEQIAIESSWGAKANAVAGKDGRFLATIATPAGGSAPQTLTFKGQNSVTVSNILIGEVWICGGQSNMEWSVTASDGAEETIKNSADPMLRLFMVANVMSLTPRSDNDGSWAESSPASVRDFSAVGINFGKELRKSLNVPVGLVSCDWGGTRAEAWMSPSAIAKFPEFNDRVAQMKLASDPNQREQLEAQAQAAWWNSLDNKGPKVGSSWTSPEFKDDAWGTLSVPKNWDGDLGNFDGVVYHRVRFTVPANLADKAATLSLGPIDDRDETFVNGKLVGATRADNLWNQARTYTIPAGTLKVGENVLAVRVVDLSGPGGIFGKPEQLNVTIDKTSIPLAGNWKFLKGATKQQIGDPPTNMTFAPHEAPSGLYNGMVATIMPYTPRGAIWYQGESNRHNTTQYRTLFPALINDWRQSFNNPDMAFHFVQLAPFRYGGDTGETALIREAQTGALALPNTGMAVTMDIGNPADIHPRNKKEVGRRLSLWALTKTYGKDVGEFSGPLYKAATFDGGKAKITFDHSKGLFAKGTAVTHVWIAGADKVFRPGTATIENDTLVVSHPKIAEPKAVRYGWQDDAEPNLFNAAGLPASPFRTDDWAKDQTKVDLSAAIEDIRDKDPAFKPLFDGKTLAGWTNVNTAPETWTVAKDDAGTPIIRCTGKPTGVLRTDAMYENFVIELEWRHMVAGGNAGLFVWSDALTAPGQPFTRSVEVQVMDGQEGPGYTSDGDIFPIHGTTMTPITRRPGVGGDRAFPTEKRMNPSPAWNHYRVECNSGSISLAVNGKVVTKGEKVSLRKGYICLESEGSEVHFRNIRIKELPPNSASIDPAMVASAAEGWTSLYTGLDFRNWKHETVHQGHWNAQDWVIDYDGKSGQDLWSTKSYKDFELIADWRFSGPAHEANVPDIQLDGTQKVGPDGKPATVKVQEAGDSGIYLRGSSKSQVNIWCWPIGSGEVYGYRTDPAMSAEVKKGVTPKVNADKPLGEWNRFHITMKGDRLTVVLNGKTVLENAQLPGVAPEGPIALQHHGDPIQFANIYIRELK